MPLCDFPQFLLITETSTAQLSFAHISNISPNDIDAQRLEGEEETMNSPWEGVSEKASWRRCHLIGA